QEGIRASLAGGRDQKCSTHILYEHLPGQPLILSPIVFLLAIFLARGAFKNYSDIQQILDLKPPSDQGYWVLDWADHVKDLPVFPTMTAKGMTQKIQTAGAFANQIRGLSIRAGMERPVTPHGIRRECLIQATSNGYSKDELMKFAAHTNQITLTRDYLSSITHVDGQGSFLKMPLRSDQAEDFRSMTVKRNPDLFLSLPAKAQDELRQRPDYVVISEQLKDLASKTDAQSRKDKSRLISRRRKLEKAELDKARSSQSRVHPKDREELERHHVDQDRSRFGRLRHMMPERRRLSNALFQVADLRSEIGISAIKDLYGLLKNDCQVAYQPSLRPIDGKCPRKECNLEIDSIDADDRWDHVFKCVKAQQQGEHKFVEFCFICNQAVGGSERWEIHCQEHVRKCEIRTRCDFVKFRRAIAYAGNCITCLHNEQLPAARRLYGFMKQSSWKKHIHECFFSYINKSGSQTELHCPDPLCSTEYDSTEDLWYHLQDAHSYPSPKAGCRLKTEKDPFMRDYAAPNRHQPKRRRIREISTDVIKKDPFETQSETICTTPSTLSILSTSCDSFDASTPVPPISEDDSHYAAKQKFLQLETSALTALAESNSISGNFKVVNTGLNINSITSMEETGCSSSNNNTSHLDPSSNSKICEPVKILGFAVELADPDLLGVTTSHNLFPDKVPLQTKSQPMAIDEEQDIWEAEELLARRRRGREIQYLVKWKGFPDDDNTWEPTKNIFDKHLIKSFNSSRR
ncbi:uncharacterized protein PpBr36_11315, partial [Pyricularia pennisetigena]|uniref:uncharacterized protein n=1 Tax=Pyricularia pennisetigena TaxID=1578925 RepID=UPI00115208BF